MRARLTMGHALAAIQIAAFWPVWKWYFLRITDGSDEPWGLAALVTCAVLCWKRGWDRESETGSLLIPAILTVLYAASLPFAPKLVSAGIAVAACGSLVTVLFMQARFHAAFFGLLLISLPVMASLQFYLGYPMRVISGHTAEILLRLSGMPVQLQGVALRWGTELVSIDAACSGVRMLWTAVFLALAASFHYGLSTLRTVFALTAAVVIVLACNGVRVAVLFCASAAHIHLHGPLHSLVGLMVFGLGAVLIVLMVRVIDGAWKCGAETCS